ncbi:hypothetical protein B9G55_09195 [Saccharibacillus sp. O16]|nr:hypothetical protein B9G55_09195 [Saccharibacillus sp. O16]
MGERAGGKRMRKDSDWEKELKQKPFRRSSFTPQMMRQVEQELEKRRPSRTSLWGRAAGITALGLMLIAGGAALERSEWLNGLGLGSAPFAKAPLDVEQSGEAGTSPAPQKPEVAFPLKNENGETAGSVSIPLSVVEAKLAIGQPENDSIPDVPQMTFALTANEAQSLQAVLMHRPDDGTGYVLLVPRAWKVQQSWIGATGSVGVDFVNPDKPGDPTMQDPGSPGERLLYRETFSGGDVAARIGTYFPDHKAWAEEQGYGVLSYAGVQFRSLYVNEGDETGFSRYDWTQQGKGTVVSGAAYYSQKSNNYTFRKLEMSLEGTAYTQTADVILRFFEANEGAQKVEASKPKPMNSISNSQTEEMNP